MKFNKINKINLNLFKNKSFLFLSIFTLGIGILLYQIYVNSIQTSLIEGLSLDDSNTKMSNMLAMFSGFFQKKCLTGCVRLDNVDKTRCTQKIDENNNKIYDCPWACDNKKFNENLKTKPDLAVQLSSSDRCAVETETTDCGSCVPNRVFTV